jgi:hypothetical protein
LDEFLVLLVDDFLFFFADFAAAGVVHPVVGVELQRASLAAALATPAEEALATPVEEVDTWR